MAKPDWGTKRACPNCGTRYYDLVTIRSSVPKCGAAFDPEALLKTRRVRVAAPVEAVAAPVAVEEEIDTELEEGAPAEAPRRKARRPRPPRARRRKKRRRKSSRTPRNWARTRTTWPR